MRVRPSRCPGRPAVEITRFVETDTTTGQVKLPAEARYVYFISTVRGTPAAVCLRANHRSHSQKLPKGKPWRDIQKYPTKED